MSRLDPEPGSIISAEQAEKLAKAREGYLSANEARAQAEPDRVRAARERREYEIKDSGARQEFEGGGMRDTEEGKLDYSNLFVWFEPMGTRYAAHMTKGRAKYPDVGGVPNWTLFPMTEETLYRTLRSLDRHFKAYRAGETDEDHAAAILFNLNLAERVREHLLDEKVKEAARDVEERFVRGQFEDDYRDGRSGPGSPTGP